MGMNLRVCSKFVRKFSEKIIADQSELEIINSIIYKYCPYSNFDNEFPEYSQHIEVWKEDWIEMINEIKDLQNPIELSILDQLELILKEADPDNDYIYLYWF